MICQWYNERLPVMAGTLFVVATPIGNLEDITARALRVLREVNLIAAEDTRRTAHLLARYAIATRTTSLHEHNERQKTATLLKRLVAGDSIALVSDAGTPTVSDPGSHLIGEAARAGIRIEPIPGPSAAIAVLSAAGVGRGSFMFLGFPPKHLAERAAWLDRVASAGMPVVFYEAPHRIKYILQDLQRRVGDVSVVVGREITKAHEELVRGPISAVLLALGEPLGEFTVVVDIGPTTNILPAGLPSPADLAAEFGLLTSNGGATRRQAISMLSRKYGASARVVYAKLEEAKTSVG